jgi:membrane-bound serine protease (ClpP class)
VGALVLFNTPTVPAFQRVSVPLVIATGVVLALSFFAVVTFAMRAQRQPVRTGKESLIGRTGFTRSEMNPRGKVQVGGELWNAELVNEMDPVPVQTQIEVVAIKGLRLVVRPVPSQK